MVVENAAPPANGVIAKIGQWLKDGIDSVVALTGDQKKPSINDEIDKVLASVRQNFRSDIAQTLPFYINAPPEPAVNLPFNLNDPKQQRRATLLKYPGENPDQAGQYNLDVNPNRYDYYRPGENPNPNGDYSKNNLKHHDNISYYRDGMPVYTGPNLENGTMGNNADLIRIGTTLLNAGGKITEAGHNVTAMLSDANKEKTTVTGQVADPTGKTEGRG